ncbi:MAG: SIR2 family NAD-dependent protein deacylase [Nannocystales bacterium]
MSTIFDRIRLRTLETLFHAEDASTVNRWFQSLLPKPPVVLVGAGFSLNARGGGSLPLWKDVGRTLAEIAGVGPEDHDVLTLADYAWTDNTNACVRKLRDSLPDDEISPGRAHQALFRSSVAAVVTTNNLDTLLDAKRVWHRVTRDLDLSLNHTQRPPLIYLHGHRDDSEGWVFTRSQYENITRSRPIIYSKVRQLLAEFPVLCVGFGLSDPNFHNIYRRIALELGGLKDRGLAILVNPVSDAERFHWASLGLRIVQIQDTRSTGEPRSFDELFAEFFSLNPKPTPLISPRPTPRGPLPRTEGEDTRDSAATSQGWVARDANRGHEKNRESAPEASTSGLDLVEELLSTEPSFAERLRLRQQYVEGCRDGLSGAAPIRLWRACLVPELPEEVAAAFLSPGLKSGDTELSFLPSDRFVTSSRRNLVPVLDRYLQRCNRSGRLSIDQVETVVEWLMVRVGGVADERSEFDYRPGLEIGLASYLIARIGAEETTRRGLAARLESKLRHCYDAAIRLDLPTEEGPLRFAEDFKATGLPLKPGQPASDAFLQAMERAGAELDDGECDSSADAYRSAYEYAKVDEFRQWLALEGVAQALNEDISLGRHDPILRDAIDDAKLARKSPTVQRWRERARARRDTLRRKTIREVVDNRSCDESARYGVWRSFRDLETSNAPRHLLRDELEPLLDWGRAIDDGRALRYRISLSLPPDATKAWLRRLGDAGSAGDSADAPSTDADYGALVDVGLEQQKSRRSRDVQLELLSELDRWAGQRHEPRIQEVLLQHLRLHNKNDYRMIRLTSLGHLTRCWSACDSFASIGSIDGARAIATDYIRTTNAASKIVFHSDIDRWAWERWTLEDGNAAAALWKQVEDTSSDSNSPHMWASLTHALATIAANSSGTTRETLVKLGSTRVGTAPRDNEETSSSYWATTCDSLLQWTISDPPQRASILASRESAIVTELQRSIEFAENDNRRLTALDSAAVGIRNLGLLGYEPREAAKRWFECWHPLADASLGRHGVSILVLGHALGWALASTEGATFNRAADRMIGSIQRDPNIIAGLPRVCTAPGVWGPRWPDLRRILWHWSSGASRADGAHMREGLLRGLTELHRNRRHAADVPDPLFVELLRDLPFVLAGDSDGEVARAAIQALGFIAQTDAVDDVDRVADVFDLAAQDPRPKIRAATAYATTRVSRFGNTESLKSRASSTSHHLGQSTSLSTQHAYTLARLETQYWWS